MDWELLQSVRNYWDGLRGERTAPCRSELDPKQFAAALENVFILERVSALDVRIRLSGAKINQVLDREGRGLAFEMLFDASSHDRLAQILGDVFEIPCTAELRLQCQTNGRVAGQARMILLPLSNENGELTRAFGCVQIEFGLHTHVGRYAIVQGMTQPIQTLSPAAAPGMHEDSVDFEKLLWPTLVASQSREIETDMRPSSSRRPNLKLISDN